MAGIQIAAAAMTALARFLQDIFDVMGLPPWAGAAAVFAVLLLALPWILRNRRTDLARRALRASDKLKGDERVAAERKALTMVAGHPMGLLVVAEEAHKLGRDGLARDAIAQLRATGKLVAELRTIERAVEGPMPATVDEAVLTIERLIDAGMRDVAAEKLARFQTRWPSEPELLAVGTRIYEGSEASPSA